MEMAIRVEARRRRVEPFGAFARPRGWGAVYASLIRSTPRAQFATVEAAVELMRVFLAPVLGGTISGGTWSHTARAWGLE